MLYIITFFGGIYLHVFTDEKLNKMKLNKLQTMVYAKYYKCLEKDTIIDFTKRIKRLNDCVTYFKWDKYEKNKILDLKKLNRCTDRFCPNCRKVSLSIALQKIEKPFKKMLFEYNYYPFLLTLTSPNVSGDDLKSTILRFNSAFNRFWDYYYKKIPKYGYKDRYVNFMAGIKSIEVTYNNFTKKYNPHLHILIFTNDYPAEFFDRYIDGPYRKKSNIYIKFS